MSKLFKLVSIISLFLFISGCSLNNSKADSKDNAKSFKDSQGNVISLAKPFQRIVSLAVSTDEILLELVPLENIVGVTKSTVRGELSNTVAKAKLVPNLVDVNSPESVYKVQPDLVIIPDFVRKDVVSTLKEMGTTVFVYKKANNYAEVKQNILDISKVVGKNPQPLLQYMDDKLQFLDNKLKNIPDKSRKRMVYLMSGGIYCNPHSPFQDMCKYAGLKDATLELNINKKTHLSKEEMIKLNPDIIIVPDFNWDGKTFTDAKVKAVLEDSAYRDVKAVKNKQVFAIKGNHLYCLSHHIVDASEDLARVAYPELFK